jgi:hypothetical protein
LYFVCVFDSEGGKDENEQENENSEFYMHNDYPEEEEESDDGMSAKCYGFLS